ncbi:hypothetical protein OIE13_13800 [Streptosporangium sp. NBC_01810]|uniref:hypothetical protein n=2 Tax=unclassified Streptosporangium TaxID=2632669 RepID=UPI002DDC1E76|nr:hypothetical protein [Streptosporangium sp. NBC_01810]WSA29815.1 hypothetical protein OIE13_13800 [Streptosporangium sp. NBC_01810]
MLAGGLGRLHAALLGGAPALIADELLDAVIPALVRRAALSGPVARGPRFRAGSRGTAGVAGRVAELLEDDYRTDHSADFLIEAQVEATGAFEIEAQVEATGAFE